MTTLSERALAHEGLISTFQGQHVVMFRLSPAATDPRLMRSATALREAGLAVTVIDVVAGRETPREEVIEGITFKHIVMPSWFVSARFKPWFLVKLLRINLQGAWRLLREEVDIYHAFVERALPAVYIAARLRRKPLIFDAPELPLADRAVLRWPRLHAIARAALRYMTPRCQGAISTSPHFVEVIERDYRGRRVTLLRNTPYHRQIPRTNRLREHLGLSAETRIALYQGILQPNRGLDLLVHAAPFLDPDVVIVMLGPDRPPTRARLEAEIARLGVADRVKILPAVPYEELLEWTASADLGLTLLPPDYSLSIRYCLPNKFFEYLMVGLPVLSSSLDMIAEIIQRYDVGSVEASTDPATVAATINRLIHDREALERMSHNARQAALEEFNWEREKGRLLELYGAILREAEQRHGHR